ncbi:hypothetical protein [Microvirga puerhi]|uniref:Uncharacterized protein n=1 Tax=Microvirga puerhi TaxID=2876078 RepID=A0ABS7VQ64_9HYPH|nr:hypothetical protein [Microvirga puerhi]MBZ6077691.1 hypothetical protein [Microvirga puerhi]
MAQDKRGRPPEPDVEEVLDDLQAEEGGQDFVAGPTQRNDVGNTKRAASKATGLMGASKKLDPDLDIDHVDDGRVRSGSSTGIHSFSEVPPERGAAEASLTLSNEEIADSVPTTVLKSPAKRPARAEASTGSPPPISPDSGRQRVPAPGNAVSAPKGTFVRGKPSKRSARGDAQAEPSLSKGSSEER